MLIVTFDPPENIGGIEGRIRGYVPELKKRGVWVEVESFGSDKAFKIDSVDGIKLYRDSANPSRFPNSLANTRRLIVDHSIDSIFLLSGAISLVGNLLLTYSRFTGRQTAVLFYGKDILRTRRRPIERLLFWASLFLADRVLTNSRYTASLLPGSARPRAVILYPGVDPRLGGISQVGPESPHLVLFVGRLVKRKGADDLIDAFHLLSRDMPDCRLEIVGDGPERKRLEHLVADLGLGGSVSFLGTLRGESLYERYRNCTLVVMPSKTLADDVEGFGTVFLEASAFGKPSVGTHSGGIPEAVVDGVTGILVPESDPRPLYEAMKKLLTNEEHRERLGKNAFSRAMKLFTWEESTKRLIRALAD